MSSSVRRFCSNRSLSYDSPSTLISSAPNSSCIVRKAIFWLPKLGYYALTGTFSSLIPLKRLPRWLAFASESESSMTARYAKLERERGDIAEACFRKSDKAL